MDYAIIRMGGFQFRVSEGQEIRVPHLPADVGANVDLDEVLAVSAGGELTVGTPTVESASVTAEVIGHGRDKKIIVYKKKRRKGYQRKKGHRQSFTELRIKEVKAS